MKRPRPSTPAQRRSPERHTAPEGGGETEAPVPVSTGISAPWPSGAAPSTCGTPHSQHQQPGGPPRGSAPTLEGARAAQRHPLRDPGRCPTRPTPQGAPVLSGASPWTAAPRRHPVLPQRGPHPTARQGPPFPPPPPRRPLPKPRPLPGEATPLRRPRRPRPTPDPRDTPVFRRVTRGEEGAGGRVASMSLPRPSLPPPSAAGAWSRLAADPVAPHEAAAGGVGRGRAGPAPVPRPPRRHGAQLRAPPVSGAARRQARSGPAGEGGSAGRAAPHRVSIGAPPRSCRRLGVGAASRPQRPSSAPASPLSAQPPRGGPARRWRWRRDRCRE